MGFYLLLLAVNIACFLPLYALNFRDRPNPIAFLLHKDPWVKWDRLKFVYRKRRFTDPFRINFDFTFVILLAAAAKWDDEWTVRCIAALLTFGFVTILYASVMQSVFKRPPALASDISLLKAGAGIARGKLYWIVPAVLVTLAAIGLGADRITAWLLRLRPSDPILPLACAVLLLPPCLFHWRAYRYSVFLARTVYSPLLHLYRNVEASRRLRAALGKKDAQHFDGHNHFKHVALSGSPSIVTVCIESYGSLVYRDPRYAGALRAGLAEHERALTARGYRYASTYSEAPIFAGGSWLSYTSFTYGTKLTDLQLFDGLFGQRSDFESYESLFHVLKRNGYKNFVLCPLGGVDSRNVDWTSIDRCFRSDRNFDFNSLAYRGPRVNYFGMLTSPPDQYSLNFAYNAARETGCAPFSLFFCTLNSHLPWNSPTEVVDDWRTLNDPRQQLALGPGGAGSEERYAAAIRYQLDFILRFALEHADDDLVIVVFGDHQPPILTPEHMGKQTPLHVFGHNETLMKVLSGHGFVPKIDLTGLEPAAIRHEGFLSLFLGALQAAYGTEADRPVAYREHGEMLFEDL